MASQYRIDATQHTAVAICDMPGCGWRGLSHTRTTAQRQMADHLRRAHGGTRHRAADLDKRARTAERNAKAGKRVTGARVAP